MDVETLARWRMHNLRLRSPAARSPSEVIGALGASQGQDYLPGLWSIAQRTSQVTAYDALTAAFDHGDLLRTHVLRPTWHLVAPADIRWLLTATAPRVHQLNGPYYRKLGVDETAVRAVRGTLESILPGRHLTRAEIGAALAENGIEARGHRLAYLLMYAELEGWVCSGARRGNQQSYALLAERAPADGRSREEALSELAARYFATRGPATVKDLAGWASLTVAEAKAARDSAGGLRDLLVDGRTYVVAGSPPLRTDDVVVDLVQAYDECIMSYSESKDVLTGQAQWSQGPASAYVHAVLVDGRLVGHWRYTRDGKGRPDTVQVLTHRELTGREKDALTAAVDRFASFTGGPVSLEG